VPGAGCSAPRKLLAIFNLTKETKMEIKELLKSDEGKAAIAKAVDKATEGLKTKNTTLLGKVQTLTERMEKFDGIDPTVYEGLVDFKKEHDDKRRKQMNKDGDHDQIIAEMKKDHATSDEKKDAQITAQAATIRTQARTTAVNTAMDKANIIGDLRGAFSDHIGARISVTGEGDETKVTVGDKSVDEFVKEYVGTDTGKHFVTADKNSGGGSGGDGGGGGLKGNPLKDDKASLTDLGALMRTDPTKAKAMMKEAGLKVIE
jgi:hypothetical protein